MSALVPPMAERRFTRLVRQYGALDGEDLVAAMAREFPGRAAVASSFGTESAVLLDLVARVDPALPVILLDTGMLFDETLSYRYRLERQLGLLDVRVVRPDPAEREEAQELWRDDPDRCCLLRKVRPMERAVAEFSVLIDGRRRAHGFERADMGALGEAGDVVKASPLWSWTDAHMERAFRMRDLPAHPLAAGGYRSVGCWPCTRPVAPGEAARAGRWPGFAKTECGIHPKGGADDSADDFLTRGKGPI